ncbi:MAG: AI-2E family transporter [Oligoflexales bacterium]
MPDTELTSSTVTPVTGFPTNKIFTVVLLIGTAITFYLCYLMLKPFISSLVWALALAVVAYPLHKRMKRKIRSNNISAALMVLMITLLFIGPLAFVTQQVTGEVSSAVGFLEKQFTSGTWDNLLAKSRLLQLLDGKLHIAEQAKGLGGAVAEQIPTALSGSAWLATEIMITLFVLFFFFRDQKPAIESLRKILPLSPGESAMIFKRISDTIYATLYGTVVVAIVQGALGGLIFWWLGLPAALLWGVIMAIMAVVPILGASVIWAPAAIYLAITGEVNKALILVAWGTIVISLIDNLLYPLLVGKRLQHHTLLVFFALLGGLMAFGTAGIILGPCVLAIADGLLQIWKVRNFRAQFGITASEPPFAGNLAS